MIVSSRTPEGAPHRCPICGKSVRVEPSEPAGDAPCPSCGHLLRWFRRRLSEKHGVSPESLDYRASFINDLGADSLDMVELVTELEAEFGITIPDEESERIETIDDAIRFIRGQLGDDWIPVLD